ncbi:uncharacterized protein JN550_004149 [Neoarthrinium moseri]|uniref:uncharacterized protein n=1 Tax=Neoarthrinium moseri TaxID=1658444 RepID=UPI001FDDC6A9|nr:uncharacterized protein JN550_004149 [Neoarthrinium moseri]KAI1871946.1 hypothetical protein JN550_004149 [Neoarthrinium moseri]
MAPIRRYLRITKYSVLECRIYLDNPALAQSWLLNPRHNTLSRVIEAVRPLVLPKLREERERARKRSTKKKGIKDVVVEDDFEVSIFLTETSTRHSLLTKHKNFHDTTQTKLTSNSGRLVGASNEAPIDLDLDAATAPITLRDEDSDEDVGAALAAIPAAPAPNSRPKRPRRNTGQTDEGAEDDHEVISSEDDADDTLFVPPDTPDQPPHKRRKEAADDGGGDDKKKLAMDISYEGFSIYGRVLCLVVKRRQGPNAAGSGRVALGAAGGNSKAKESGPPGGGQAMMENFIISTQVPAGEEGP